MRDFSKSKNYQDAQTISNGGVRERLPAGGYVLKIQDARHEENEYGEKIVLEFDIFEGEHELFYNNDFADQPLENQKWKGNFRLFIPKDDGSEKDGMTMQIFKTAIKDFEESNENFRWDWDEKKLKGLIIGGVFRNKEWAFNGKTGFFTECAYLKSVADIRNGNFRIPKDKMLKTDTAFSDLKAKIDKANTEDNDDLPF